MAIPTIGPSHCGRIRPGNLVGPLDPAHWKGGSDFFKKVTYLCCFSLTHCSYAMKGDWLGESPRVLLRCKHVKAPKPYYELDAAQEGDCWCGAVQTSCKICLIFFFPPSGSRSGPIRFRLGLSMGGRGRMDPFWIRSASIPSALT